MTSQQLKAQQGRAHNMRLDAKAKEQLKHLRLFIATKMNLQVSDSVLIRRALDLLNTHYEKLIRSTWITGRESQIIEERLYLSSAASGSHSFRLEPVDILSKRFPTWEQRVEASHKDTIDLIEEQEAYNRREQKKFYQRIGRTIQS